MLTPVGDLGVYGEYYCNRNPALALAPAPHQNHSILPLSWQRFPPTVESDSGREPFSQCLLQLSRSMAPDSGQRNLNVSGRYLSFLNFQRKISACLFFFFFFLSMGKAYDAWNCSHCPVTMWEQPQDHEDADPKPGHCRATKPILEMPVSRLLVR